MARYQLVFGEPTQLRKMKDMVEVLFQGNVGCMLFRSEGPSYDEDRLKAFDRVQPDGKQVFVFMEWCGHARQLMENAHRSFVITENQLYEVK
jgi:hypothetical protein